MTLVENEKCNQKLFLFCDFAWFYVNYYCPHVQGMVSWVIESSKWALKDLYSKYLYEIKEFRLLFLIA